MCEYTEFELEFELESSQGKSLAPRPLVTAPYFYLII